ncbi:TetR/AcrR family transcriptional regulator [Bacillus sp. FJAT-27916]|uniref:TetR/AcrR family transcriptional regulator n=1 Tax=Bacillus sp. FJAT-27916 TaxID=1679169 RepID=UPI000A5250AE|nr:TetR/AcrR family transcriptional regulator [Bacillus sp. FJAT-27916]
MLETKSRIIETATVLFQQKGYKGVGLNELLRECSITKGSLYHHFPNGKEELLIACLHSLNESITSQIEDIFAQHTSALVAVTAMIDMLIAQYEETGAITGFTVSSMVSEMASLSDPVREACAQLYENLQVIYSQKLMAEGFTETAAQTTAVSLSAIIEGGMMLCLAQKSAEPLRIVANMITKMLRD